MLGRELCAGRQFLQWVHAKGPSREEPPRGILLSQKSWNGDNNQKSGMGKAS